MLCKKSYVKKKKKKSVKMSNTGWKSEGPKFDADTSYSSQSSCKGLYYINRWRLTARTVIWNIICIVPVVWVTDKGFPTPHVGWLGVLVVKAMFVLVTRPKGSPGALRSGPLISGWAWFGWLHPVPISVPLCASEREKSLSCSSCRTGM